MRLSKLHPSFLLLALALASCDPSDSATKHPLPSPNEDLFSWDSFTSSDSSDVDERDEDALFPPIDQDASGSDRGDGNGSDPGNGSPPLMTLRELLSPFDSSPSTQESKQSARLQNLALSFIKPELGQEKGGYFLLDPEDGLSVYLENPRESGLPEGQLLSLTVHQVSRQHGLLVITDYEALQAQDASISLAPYRQDATAWLPSDWEQKEGQLIQLLAFIMGEGQAAGGGEGGWLRFGIATDGYHESAYENDPERLKIRLPEEKASHYDLNDSCLLDLENGVVWAFDDGENLQYQPLFTLENLRPNDILCDAPKLLSIEAIDLQHWALNFSRKMDTNTLNSASLQISPPLGIQSLRFENDNRRLIIRTETQDAGNYSLSFSSTVTDTLGEALYGPGSYNIKTELAYPRTAAIFCFDDMDGNFDKGPTMLYEGLSEVSDLSRHEGASLGQGSAGNSLRPPSPCLEHAGNKAINNSGWPTMPSDGREAAPDLERSYGLSFTPSENGEIFIAFDAKRSDKGPQKLAIGRSGEVPFASGISIPTTFSESPMFPASGLTFSTPVEKNRPLTLRFYPYAAESSAGTFSLDHLTLKFTPEGQ